MMPPRVSNPLLTWRSLTYDQRHQIKSLIVVIVPFLLLLFVAFTILMATFTSPLRVKPPYTFSSPVYLPVDGEVCPGETLTWPVRFDVQRAPVMVISVRSIWSVDANQSAPVPIGTFPLIFTNYTETVSVSRTTSITVPPLPPGRYELRGAAQEFTSQAAAYSTPFVVPAGCPVLPEAN